MSGERINSKIIILGLFCLAVIIGAVWYVSSGPKEFFSKIKIPKNEPSVKIFIAGDMMLDRNVRLLINKNSFNSFFAGVKDTVRSADIAVANLEGPFTTFPSVTTNPKNTELKFTFDPAGAPGLADLGFDVLGLANNHSMNFGSAGLEMTRRYIGTAGMQYYGDPNNKDEISTIITKNGIKVGFVGFHEFTYYNFDKVFAEVARLRPQVDILIVSPHWGVEYQKEPTEKMKKWAHEFIDLGADAVIGAHPHIVGNIEEYQGKKIFYSLGNFVFDQYFSEETMNGLAVMIDVQKNKDRFDLNYTQIPIRVDREGVRVLIPTK